MTDLTRAEIARFVRGTLGCACPDEVFQSIAISRLPDVAAHPAMVQLLVGSRLLIHVVAPPAGRPASGWIEQLAANGRAARDRYGCNRFRLVVATPVPRPSAREIQECFARAIVGDERAHLHFVAPDELPAGLELPA